jgi:subtilisin family serine protease
VRYPLITTNPIMDHLEIVKLPTLMERTCGRPEIVVGLIDGPITMNHVDLASRNIREIPGSLQRTCTQANSVACIHGTFIAGILCAKRGSRAPAICPECTLLVHPIFLKAVSGEEQMLSATPEELATAIIKSIEAGVHVLNLSVALVPSSRGQSELEEALDYALRRGVLVIAAAGNQGTIGSTAITCHPWVIPVAACDLQGRPISYSNLGNSIGRRGLNAPGDNVISLGVDGKLLTLGGTSVATPFVTGTIALLWSEFPTATAAEMKFAITQASMQRRKTVVPPLLDAWTAYQLLMTIYERKRML